MTSENIDIRFIKTIGNEILVKTPAFAVLTLLYGIFLLLFCISTVIFIRRGLKTCTQWMMAIISIICFALFSLNWALGVMEQIVFVKLVLVDNITLPKGHNVRLYEIKMASIGITREVIGEVLAPISDMVVVWRAWVIFPSQRRWMIGPVILLVCTFGITIIHILSYDFYRFRHAPPPINLHIPVVNGLFAGEIVASMMTNLAATLLIAYNLWDHRKHVSGNLRIGGHQRSLSQAEKVLAVLVESGAVYCVIQAITLVLLLINRHSMKVHDAFKAIGAIYTGISAMYPIIVVMLVHLQLSFEHTYGFSIDSQPQEHEHRNASRLPTIGQLKFAPANSSNSIMNKESGDILEESRERESNV